MDRHVQISEIVDAGTDALLGSIYVSMPGSVVSYNPTNQTAVVQPTLADVRFDLDTGEPVYEPWPQMTVRVMWPSFGGMVLAGPMKAFDTVSLLAWDFDPSVIANPGNAPVSPANVRKLGGHAWRAVPEALLPLLAVDATAAAGAFILGVQGGAQLQIAHDGSSVSIVKAPIVNVGDASAKAVNLGPATMPLALAPPVAAAFVAIAAYAAALTAAGTAAQVPPLGTNPPEPALLALAQGMVAAGSAIATALATAETATPAQVVKGA